MDPFMVECVTDADAEYRSNQVKPFALFSIPEICVHSRPFAVQELDYAALSANGAIQGKLSQNKVN